MSAGLAVRGLVAGYGPNRVLDGIDIGASAGRGSVMVRAHGAGQAPARAADRVPKPGGPATKIRESRSNLDSLFAVISFISTP